MYTLVTETKHTFELSGLGKPPYVVVNPKQNPLDQGVQFWCDHCGTCIKNRNFIKSSDGKVSIVGIDCLRKTGDQGLIDGVKRLKREAQAQIKQAQFDQRLEAERAVNGGKSNMELASAIDQDIETKIRVFISTLVDNPVVLSLNKHGFETAMVLQAHLVRPYTDGQLVAMKKAYTRKLTGAAVNQKVYKEAYPGCEKEIVALQASIVALHDELEQLGNKARLLRFG
jgi:hypothetical protein